MLRSVLSSRCLRAWVSAILSCLVLCCTVGLAGNVFAEEKGKSAGKKVRKILFLGNSITKHGPSAKIGWHGNWGMAASAADKDFVHVVVRGLGERNGKDPQAMVKTIVDFERGYAGYDALKSLQKALDFKADTIVLAIGENVSALQSEQSKSKFKSSLLKLLAALQTDNNPTIIVRSSFWADKTKDQILRQSCKQVGGIFVDISSLCKDESTYARAEVDYSHAGVAAHPGDKGMRAIGEAILKAMEK